jgi:hypothetical protein
VAAQSEHPIVEILLTEAAWLPAAAAAEEQKREERKCGGKRKE